MIVVLGYHKVGAPIFKKEDRRLNTSPEGFARQVNWFRRRGWQAPTPSQLANNHFDPKRNTVVFTFDDAYEKTVETAAPILQAAGFTGSFFAVSSMVGQNSQWDGDRGTPLADWPTLKKWAEQGFAIDNHSRTHCWNAKLSADELEAEVMDAEEAIFTKIGIRSKVFCYPYGFYNKQVLDILRKHDYTVSFTVKRGFVTPESPRLELPRVMVAYSDGLMGLLYRLYLRPKLGR